MSTVLPVLKAPEVVEVIDRAAAPRQARLVLTRLLDAHPELADRLASDRLLVSALVALSGASRSLSEAVIADAGLLAPLDDPDGLAAECPHERYTTRALQAVEEDAADPGRGLRRWKRQQLLRIAVRDLLGLADLPAVGRELASLAEGCLQAALALAEAAVGDGVRMALIGMGKLGGRELNYSSDVDVLFVHDGRSAAAERVARHLLTTMAQPTPYGIVFRTDADLRPEGRAGPLSRSLDAYRGYWDKWASNWEFQALIKARPVAGDAELGRAFMEAAQPHVWPERLDPDAVREVRMMKARAEEEVSKRGLTEREIKKGRGGLRDIEFAVQLLQLVHARHDPGIRSPNTLEALEQLGQAGYVDTAQVRTLDAAYRFLRTVEHRLQLVDEAQVHALPSDAAERTRLARVLGYRDEGSATALEQFQAAHRRQQAQVRSIHEKLFFRPLLEAFAGTGPLSQEAAEDRPPSRRPGPGGGAAPGRLPAAAGPLGRDRLPGPAGPRRVRRRPDLLRASRPRIRTEPHRPVASRAAHEGHPPDADVLRDRRQRSARNHGVSPCTACPTPQPYDHRVLSCCAAMSPNPLPSPLTAEPLSRPHLAFRTYVRYGARPWNAAT